MIAPSKVHLTQDGYQELKDELHKLKEKEPKAIERVSRARDYGDLSENSEYHAAREDLAFIQGRLDELEDLINRAEIINSNGSSKVQLGNKVTVKTHTGKEMTFTIVGEYEADPKKKKISPDSPLGQALLGKKVEEQAEFEAPVGKVVYTIQAIN